MRDKVAKVGRPTSYTPELAKKICDKIASGYKSLDKLHSEHKDWFPDSDTILEWRNLHPEFSAQYLDAKRMQAELGAEELKKVSESVMNCIYIDKEGNKRIDQGAVSALSLISNNIKWATGRLAPKLYGERKTEQDGTEEQKLVIELKHD